MGVLETLQLKLGGRVDILLENKQIYISKIEDVISGERLLVSAPISLGMPVILRREDRITLVYVLDSGRYGIPARVVGHKTEGAARLVIVQPYGEPDRIFLRNAYRQEATLRAIMRDNIAGPFPLRREGVPVTGKKRKGNDDEEEEAVTTVNISESGVSLRSRTKYSTNDKFYLRIWLEWPTPEAEPIDFFCETRRRELADPEGPIYIVGAKFLGLDDETRRHLSRYIIVKQQQIIKHRRLMEDD